MTYKTKNIILLCSLVLLAFTSYKLGISKTLGLVSEEKSLTKEALLIEDAPAQFHSLSQEQAFYHKGLEEFNLNNSSIHNSLLQTINEFAEANDLKLVSFLEPHVVSKNKLSIKTYQFTLEGDFSSIQLLVYKLEQETKFGEIINLHFMKKKNHKKGTYFLQANVFLRSFV